MNELEELDVTTDHVTVTTFETIESCCILKIIPSFSQAELKTSRCKELIDNSHVDSVTDAVASTW